MSSDSTQSGWISADGCSTGFLALGSCTPESNNELSNSNFDNTGGITIDQWSDCNSEFPFGVSPKVVQGNWFASHGSPLLGHGSPDNSLTLKMGASSEYANDSVIKKSEGLYYQFPQNLSPSKRYKLKFMAEGSYDMFQNRFMNQPKDTVLDKLHIYLASGLQPYSYKSPNCPANYSNYTGENQFLPTYPFVLHKLGEFSFSVFWEWYCAEIVFAPPGNRNFNQLWIFPESVMLPNPLTDTYYEDWLDLDDVSLTTEDYFPSQINLTANNGLPALVKSSKTITAGNGTMVNNYQTVQFQAGESIELSEGFSAEYGSDFTAEIVPVSQKKSEECECNNENYASAVYFAEQHDVTGSHTITLPPKKNK